MLFTRNSGDLRTLYFRNALLLVEAAIIPFYIPIPCGSLHIRALASRSLTSTARTWSKWSRSFWNLPDGRCVLPDRLYFVSAMDVLSVFLLPHFRDC
jgi:hypothetical protein